VREACRRAAHRQGVEVGWRLPVVWLSLEGCRRMYFGMSVSAPYLEATITAAAVARQQGDLDHRLTHDYEAITGKPATTIRDFVAMHPEVFGPSSQTTAVSGSR
jgi:hypothetical protein